MLLIPVHQRVDRRNLPWATALLVLLNVLVWFQWQLPETETWTAAVQQASVDGLGQIEGPWLAQFYERRGDAVSAQQLRELTTAEEWPMIILLAGQEEDFQAAMRAGHLLDPASDPYPQWSRGRSQLDAELGALFSRRWAFDTAQPGLVTALTAMFMHAGLIHLVGNMLFLGLLGVLVEGAIPRPLYLGAYLLSGLGATASFWLFSSSQQQLVGASGAIAGLMGLYAVLFGTRRVRCFYWAFIYFEIRKAPALAFLPVWLAWELLQWMLLDSNVAYSAHAGGLVCGATLGFLLIRGRLQNRDYLDHDTKQEALREGLSQGRRQLAQMDFEAASRTLGQLAEEHPTDAELLETYYRAARVRAGSEPHRDAAARIFALAGTADHAALVRKTWADYRSRCGKLSLAPGHILKLAECLGRSGNHDDCGALLGRLVRIHPSLPGLLEAGRQHRQRLLADAKLEEAERWQKRLSPLQPDPWTNPP